MKFRINSDQCESLLAMVEQYMCPDRFAQPAEKVYQVESLYFDSGDFRSVEQKRSGDFFKEKFRLRSYQESEDECFLEIKRKKGDWVSKSRSHLFQGALPVLQHLQDGKPFPMSMVREGKEELVEFFYHYFHQSLRPVMWVRFRRQAYECPWGSGLRLTFDYQLQADWCQRRDGHGRFREGRFLKSSFGNWIFEVKSSEILPSWLMTLLPALQGHRQAFSKYAEAYTELSESCPWHLVG